MEGTVNIPEYDKWTGTVVELEADCNIEASYAGNEIVLFANPAGLRSLGKLMLYLAQEAMPDGNHMHFSPGQHGIAADSSDFVIGRLAVSPQSGEI